MDSIKLSIDTSGEGLELLCSMLNDLGFEQLEIVDDVAGMRDDLAKSAAHWDYVEEEELLRNGGQTQVCLYLTDDEEAQGRVEALQARLLEIKGIDFGVDIGSLCLLQERIKEEDWRDNWRQFYKPVSVGERLMVVPEWERETVQENERCKLYIEPGLSFGTGEHQTTQLCLEALEERLESGDVVLDLGSGSGILSVAALLLGASFVRAVDVDLNSKKVSRENAKLNQIDAEKFDMMIGDALQDAEVQRRIEQEPYDLIVANIVADVIIRLAPFVCKWLKEEALFISSGIIEERGEEVEKAILQAGFLIEERKEKEGWLCFIARLKGRA